MYASVENVSSCIRSRNTKRCLSERKKGRKKTNYVRFIRHTHLFYSSFVFSLLKQNEHKTIQNQSQLNHNIFHVFSLYSNSLIDHISHRIFLMQIHSKTVQQRDDIHPRKHTGSSRFMSIFFFLIKVIIIALIIELFPQKDMKEDIERCYYDKKITLQCVR